MGWLKIESEMPHLFVEVRAGVVVTLELSNVALRTVLRSKVPLGPIRGLAF